MTYSELYDAVWTARSEEARQILLRSLSPARSAAWRIMGDLRDRKGIGDEIDQCDDDVRDEIFAAMEHMVAEETK